MVIVHPDEVARLAVSRNCLGVTLVHCFVGLPVGGLEVAKVLQVVKQRPDYFVGIAVVKLIALCLAQRHRHYLVASVAGGFGERRVRDLAAASGPTNPRPPASAQHWSKRTNEPAGRRRDAPLALAGWLKCKRQPVGNEDEAIHLARVKKVKRLHRYNGDER